MGAVTDTAPQAPCSIFFMSNVFTLPLHVYISDILSVSNKLSRTLLGLLPPQKSSWLNVL